MANVIRKRAVISRSLTETANRKDDLKDLYVFGYQCTLFRDDEKAVFIDQGKHLIPWMGNDNLLIDRYDGRGHLLDLKDYDADQIRKAVEPLSEDEQQIEKLCDEERYLELNTDVLEKMLYEEEEMKRLNEALASDSSYSAVGFNYDSSQNEQHAADQRVEELEDEDLRPYVPQPALHLPASILPPKTEKIHAIIERTAAFTAQHGVQMEIMIKAKQKDNPQFGFLNYEDELNAYYKHLVECIKLGKYVPSSGVTASSSSSNGNDTDTTHSYLHPSLSGSSAVVQDEPEHISSEAFLDSVSAKLPAGQIANTSYAKLLSNLTKHARINTTKPATVTGKMESIVMAKSTASDVVDVSKSLPSSMKSSTVNLVSASDGTQAQHPAVPGLAPVTLPSLHHSSARKTQSTANRELAVYGPTVVPPPPDMQPIIDKMADYVARNGPEFEFVVRRRKDERFSFLDADHPLHPYYQHKKRIFVQEIEKKKEADMKQEQEVVTVQKEPSSEVNDEDCIGKETMNGAQKPTGQSDDKDGRSQSKGVSFMIKTKEEEAPILRKSTALPYESSSESSTDSDDSAANSDSTVSSAAQMNGLTHSEGATRHRAGTAIIEHSAFIKSRSSTPAPSTDKAAPSTDKAPAEVVCRKEVERLADKLSMAARDKLAQASLERQLQAQRKRRAAAFLNSLRQTDPGSPASDLAPNAVATGESLVSLETASVPASNSRCSTPAASIPSPSCGSSPCVEVLDRLSLPTTTVSSTSKSSRRHRSRSPHQKRSGSASRSKKHPKLPSTYVSSSRRSRSKSPVKKSSSVRKHSHSSKHKVKDATDRSHKSSTKHSRSESRRSPSSSSKKKRRTDDRDHSRHKSKRRHKSKKSVRSYSSSSSTSSSSSSSRRPSTSSRKQSTSRSKKSKHRRRYSTASSRSSDIDIIEIPDDPPQDSSDPTLVEMKALIEAKRRELLSEEIVILD